MIKNIEELLDMFFGEEKEWNKYIEEKEKKYIKEKNKNKKIKDKNI